MWVLVNQSTGKKYYLLSNQSISVGRKGVDIVIEGDSSVSRKHATIHISYDKDNLKNPDAPTKILLTDSSKFGTHVTRADVEKLTANKALDLLENDEIQFGAQSSIFKLIRENLVVCTSMLDDDIKDHVESTLISIGGHLISSWNADVSYLVTEKIKLSIKVVRALACACHIVTPEFLFQLKNQVDEQQVELEPEKYLPELAEPSLSQKDCSFKINSRRRTVFQGKVFVFVSKKQVKQMGAVVKAGGGDVIVADESQPDKAMLSNVYCCVVSVKSGSVDDITVSESRYLQIQEELVLNEKRLIADHEIGLAVLYADSKIYCNPVFDLNSQNALTQRPDSMAFVDSRKSNEMKPNQSLDKSPIRKNNQFGENSGTYLTFGKRGSSPMYNQRANKKQKISDSESLETFSDDHKVESKENRPHSPEHIPDSCLDDDSLWSQNMESQSYIHREIDQKTVPVFQSYSKTDLSAPQSSHIDKQNKISEFRQTKKKCSPLRHNDHVKHQLSDIGVSNQKNLRLDELVADVKPNSIVTSSQVEAAEYDPSLPRNLAECEFIQLVVNHHDVADQEVIDENITNFKRFKKVWPTYMEVKGSSRAQNQVFIPKIIGGSDFFINGDSPDFNKESRKFEEFWSHQESQESNPFASI